MAGKRRRGDGLPPKPRLRDLKAERRRERLAAELGAAATPRQRLTVAVDFVKTCLQATQTSGPAVSVPALVRELIGAGDQLWAARRRARLETEMAAAQTARDQLGVALEYVRRALAGADDPAVQQTADQVVEPLVRRLVAAGEQMQKGDR